ncbi:site-specific DNA-methyltransferase [Lactiplantibacillus plantarum]|uniref:DNA-methyltransferase n=1 Tax=Lactiplantibacillus plantarum TaxID=1590 RepID=UPI00265520C0|nr:site-specific DNA-methyltransferase [Lactiplantibacillus plantarum]MDN7060901.1 site-specific DNA-methyltransferase [Lactiplantibacillus plantarum]
MSNINLLKGDCFDLMKKLPNKSVDAIVTDPPYEYLNHKLDRRFNEEAVFEQWNRVVKDNGMILFFGRGESFYRWNYLLNQMGWHFKEEVIWNKRLTSTPMLPIGRIHETISILSKDGKIRKVKVPYLEKNKYDLKKIVGDVKRVSSALNNPSELSMIGKYLETGENSYTSVSVNGITLSRKTKTNNKGVDTVKGFVEGRVEQDVIEQLAIRNRKKQFHPTQKPTPLMERLISLVSDEGNVILDPFMGSGSTGVAAANLDRSFIGYEIDDDYFRTAEQRINEARRNVELF